MESGRKKNPTNADYKRRCHKTACSACGLYDCRTWVGRHHWKVAALHARTSTYTLTWPKLPTCKASVESVLLFFAAVERLRRRLASDYMWLRNVIGFVLKTEINFLPRSRGGQFQLHGHLLIVFATPQSQRSFPITLAALWKAPKGQTIESDDDRENSSLAGFLYYCAKHPVQVSDEEADEKQQNDWRMKLQRCVLNDVERELGRPAIAKHVEGILKGHKFREMEDRAHYEQLPPDEQATSPSRKAAPLPEGVNRVLVKPRCPQCRGVGRKIIKWCKDRHGEQRYRCKKCAVTFLHRHRSPHAEKLLKNSTIPRKEANAMRKLFEQGTSVAAIARHFNRAWITVKKVIEYFREQSRQYNYPGASAA
ncbi:MAG: hypothetical protein GC159_08050 [Phycisphaera sp.]|nr:hypothetical protein [Phycisphaera sp.]